jgi:hypothetical protein
VEHASSSLSAWASQIARSSASQYARAADPLQRLRSRQALGVEIAFVTNPASGARC